MVHYFLSHGDCNERKKGGRRFNKFKKIDPFDDLCICHPVILDYASHKNLET